MTEKTEMPVKIYACPRGSGTVSGVWTDKKCGDEPETKYFREDEFVAGMKRYQGKMIELIRECADRRLFLNLSGREALKLVADKLEGLKE